MLARQAGATTNTEAATPATAQQPPTQFITNLLLYNIDYYLGA
jgi:hypothetical protein